MDNLLQTLSVYSVLLPFFAGLVFWKFQDANARIMVVLLAFASVSQLSFILPDDKQNVIYNLYIIVDVFFWSLLLYRNAFSKIAKAIILILFLLFNTIALIEFYKNGISKSFITELVSLDLIIQVFFVLIYFIEKYRSGKITRLRKEPMFWFCLGIMLYAPGTYLLFSTRHIISDEVFKSVWKYHHLFNIILYLLITVGFLTRINKNILNKR